MTCSISYPSVLILRDQGKGAAEGLDFASCVAGHMGYYAVLEVLFLNVAVRWHFLPGVKE